MPPTHPHIATTLNNLATLYREQGHYDKAEPMFKRALSIQEKSLGTDHPHIAGTLNNLALLYQATNRESEAKKLEIRAARIEQMRQ